MFRQLRHTLLVCAVTILVIALSSSSAGAVVPPSAFGYVTLCHAAGTPEQQTLILLPSEIDVHLAHGDPQVRCAEPIPPTVYDPDVDLSGGYFVGEIGDGLYWVTEGVYQMMFMVTNQGVIVVDAPPSIGPYILSAIADVTDKPITHVVYTHSHADHIGAAGIYPEDAIVIAQEETAAQLEAAMSGDREYGYGVFVGGGPVPLPNVTFKKQFTLRRGDQELKLEYKGPNHQPGNIFVYAPKQRVLMLVDVVFPGWTPFADLALAKDFAGFYEAHDQALAYDFNVFVGGHLTRLGTRQDVELQRDYALDVRTNAALAMQQVDFGAIVQETGVQNTWLMFSTYLDTVAQTCADATLAEWSGVLAGADIFTFGHCWVATASLRLE